MIKSLENQKHFQFEYTYNNIFLHYRYITIVLQLLEIESQFDFSLYKCFFLLIICLLFCPPVVINQCFLWPENFFGGPTDLVSDYQHGQNSVLSLWNTLLKRQCHFWTSLWDVAFEHHFWMSLFDVTFGHHFWNYLLDVTFEYHFWTSLLDISF